MSAALPEAFNSPWREPRADVWHVQIAHEITGEKPVPRVSAQAADDTVGGTTCSRER